MSRPFNLSVYFVADPSCCAGRSIDSIVIAALQGGATMLQLRNKFDPKEVVFEQALRLAALAADFDVPLLINDYPDIALQAKADGVHIGQGDVRSTHARALLGARAIVGLTAFRAEHFSSVDRGLVSYAGTGPVYPTQTDKGKPILGLGAFSDLVSVSSVPVVGIGGINAQNAGDVMRAGARGVAVMRAISEADSPKDATRALVESVMTARQDIENLNRRAS